MTLQKRGKKTTCAAESWMGLFIKLCWRWPLPVKSVKNFMISSWKSARQVPRLQVVLSHSDYVVRLAWTCQRSSPACCDVCQDEFYCIASDVTECSNIWHWSTHEQSFATVVPDLGDLCHSNANATQANSMMILVIGLFFLLLRHKLFVLPFQKEEHGFTNISVSFQESVLLVAVWELSPACVTPQQCYWQKTSVMHEISSKKRTSLRKCHCLARSEKGLRFVCNCV